MRYRIPLVAFAAAALAVAPAARAQSSAQAFDVVAALEGVWAYDPYEVAEPGDFTCEERPMAIAVVDGGRRLAAKRSGDAAERYGLVLDVRNDYPLGPALSVVWEDASERDAAAPTAAVFVMENRDTLMVIDGGSLNAYLAGAPGLERSQRRTRCEAETE
jgi:hypothetical protein